MTDHDLSELMEHLGERTDVGTAPTARMLADAGRLRRRRTTWVAVGAAAAVLAVVGGVALLGQQPGPGEGDGPPASDPAPRSRLFGVGHVAVEVPATWGTNDLHCGTPQRDTVVLAGGGNRSCLSPYPVGVESLWLGRPTDFAQVDLGTKVEQVHIDGARAERTPTVCAPRQRSLRGAGEVCQRAVHFPDHDVTVLAASSTSRAEVDRLVERIRIMPDMVAVPRFDGGNNTVDPEPEVDVYVRRLEGLGLGAELRIELAPGVDAGDVRRTSPEPGTVLHPGDTVVVTAAAAPRGPADEVSVGLTSATGDDDVRTVDDADFRAGATIRVRVGDRMWAYAKGHREETLTGVVSGSALAPTDRGAGREALSWRASRPGSSTITLTVSDGGRQYVVGTLTVVVE